MNFPRRRFLCFCAGATVLPGCGGGGASETNGTTTGVRGCSLTARSQIQTGGACGQATNTTGNSTLDNALFQEFQRQRQFFPLPAVTFQLLNDCQSDNAYADPSSMGILYGITLASKTLNTLGNYLPLYQVIAHEYGHMMQFAFGASWLDSNTVAPRELEADMFSGFYLLLNYAFASPTDMASTITKAFQIGDLEFNNPSHHGTPFQRGAAVLAGARVANEYYAGQIPRTWDAVRQRFYFELRQIIVW